MNPGQLRHRITIQHVSGTTTNTSGEEIPRYVNWKTAWASVEPLKGREYLEAQKLRAELTYRIKIRYLADLEQSMRVKFKDRIFRIESIINLNEANREIHFMCVEQVI